MPTCIVCDQVNDQACEQVTDKKHDSARAVEGGDIGKDLLQRQRKLLFLASIKLVCATTCGNNNRIWLFAHAV